MHIWGAAKKPFPKLFAVFLAAASNLIAKYLQLTTKWQLINVNVAKLSSL